MNPSDFRLEDILVVRVLFTGAKLLAAFEVGYVLAWFTS